MEQNPTENLTPFRYFILNKPYNMVSQFISSHKVKLLGDLEFDFPEGTHAVGRLDINSEGLLILTTNKKVTRLLFEGDIKHTRTYLVLVENKVSEETLDNLRNGVTIRVKGGGDYTTTPCEVDLVEKPENLFEGGYKFSEYKAYTWLQLKLTEGKFRQVRKMVAAVRHPCKRLIRVAIEDLTLKNLQPGCIQELEENEFFELLNIENFKNEL
ncbi:pseudouridine synthase [Segetibacter aerophilus]|uniref:Pseudouridine synthase n=1 Tax=Segetibacter aerophilus TaxID=670293 RepID=A0A512B7X2_9BACT|nr:pseudouridine synthase [Segetibacter aerophilus]GEO08073.1 pseudouridine synthase [Segetibacter aerophilus]